jgi:2,3-bisphosphoglycerate-dependent phosphoglycerate mutase
MAYLALIRHGQSILNSQNKECGWIDSPLTDQGKQEAILAASKLPKNIKWDYLYESDLTRSKQTSDIILNSLKPQNSQRVSSPALKERNYGIYAGQDKTTVPHEIRRGWDPVVEEGENLKQVYERVVPYFQTEIEPKLKSGKNVIISAHGNSLRALVKYLKNISDEEIPNLEIPTGEVLLSDYTSPPVPPDPSPQT